jgi:hypothetical protein
MDYIHLTEDADGVSRFEDRAFPMTMATSPRPRPRCGCRRRWPRIPACSSRFPRAGAARSIPPRGNRSASACRAASGSRPTAASGIRRGRDLVDGRHDRSGHTTTVLGDEDVRMCIVQLGSARKRSRRCAARDLALRSGRNDDNPGPDPVTPHRGVLLALRPSALATHDAIIKYLGASYSPFQIVFFSVLFGFPMVTFLMMRDASRGNLRPVHPWWTALRTGAVVIAAAGFYAFTALPLAQVYAILFAAPLLITSSPSRSSASASASTAGWPSGRPRRRDRRAAARPRRSPRPYRGVVAAVGGRLRLRHHAQDRAGGTRRRPDPLPDDGQFRPDGRGMPFVYEPMPGQDLALLAVAIPRGTVGV